MILEQQPRLDVHRLATAGRCFGALRLKGGHKLQYVIGLSADDEPMSLAAALNNGGHYHYQLKTVASSRTVASCPDCGRWVEQMYWSNTLLDQDKDASASCRLCVGATYLSSHYSRVRVPGYRADLRAGQYEPIINAIQSGDYIAARIAIEKEFALPNQHRMFTQSDGQKARWAYKSQE